jgi:prepilin-type N-terminal cleavage/methylation domain
LEITVNHRISGFTLIELLVTITVAAVLLAVAVPNFQNLMLSNKLGTSANAVVYALNLGQVRSRQTQSGCQFHRQRADQKHRRRRNNARRRPSAASGRSKS